MNVYILRFSIFDPNQMTHESIEYTYRAYEDKEEADKAKNELDNKFREGHKDIWHYRPAYCEGFPEYKSWIEILSTTNEFEPYKEDKDEQNRINEIGEAARKMGIEVVFLDPK